jgi:polysaccharide biosynthesis protein PelE
MTGRGAIAAFAATGFEALGVASALHGSALPALSCHAAACVCFAGTLQGRLLGGPRVWAFALLFAAAFFVPVLGVLGIGVVALTTESPSGSAEREWVRTPIPAPSAMAGRADANAEASSTRQARVESLSALRGRSDPTAIALLRRALEDPEEDVRLVAYSLLESKSRAAYRDIHELTRALEEAPAQRPALHRLLAFQHWELARLGLAQGECLTHALEMARHHALLALECGKGSASLWFLLGRIYLRGNEPDQAERAFTKAAQLGAARLALAPWIAEAKYGQRRFDVVHEELAEMDVLGGSETVERLRRYWT